jgi:hypothetical protein
MSRLPAAAFLAILVVACTKGPTSGVRGDLTYVGGPNPSALFGVPQPGRVVAYGQDGVEADSADFRPGEGFTLSLAPGTYRLAATSGDADCRPKTITVVPDTYETVRVRCSVK